MNQKSLVDLNTIGATPFRRALFSLFLKPLVSKLFCVPTFNEMYADVTQVDCDMDTFLQRALELFNVHCSLSEEERARIPAKGPVVIMANHPFGAIEGIVLASLLRAVRPDVKIMVTKMLKVVPDIRDLFIFVDNLGADSAASRNLAPLKESLRHLKNGGALVIFPAGEVSSVNLRKRVVQDPPWSPSVAGIVRRAKVPVLPMFFDGANGPLFHLLGLVHPRLRTAMLPRELLNKRDRTLNLKVGCLIPPAKLKGMESDQEVINYLRLRTYMLKSRNAGQEGEAMALPAAPVRPAQTEGPTITPVIQGPDPSLLQAEVAALPAESLLLSNGPYDAYVASATQAPHMLREIGRLRELTFRDVGEGTGKEIDLDDFDDYYHHLFLWNREQGEIVGAYRVGRTDLIIAAHGVSGLYTSTLFKFKPALFDKLGPALEMGRSFVRKEYQKSYSPLLLLWKGIAQFVIHNPEYKTLFGPVSISSDYSSISRELIVRHLRTFNRPAGLAKLVKAKTPPKLGGLKRHEVRQLRQLFCSIEDVSAVITDIESVQKGIPILLKQYLKLGGQVLGFNVDPEFQDALDGLLVVNLLETDRKVLTHYMGKEGAEHFLAHHGMGEAEDETVPA